jgi:predicted RNase H-like nuclease (RuvC/YqgF family)|tara:strand:+ start:272 stop:574 length:303 start_codon:yes stop_codon:yes gene_type:complete
LDIVPHYGISICGGVVYFVENMVGDKLNEQSKSITSLERKVNLLNNVILNPHKYNTKIVTLEMMDKRIEELKVMMDEVHSSIEDIHVELAQLRSNDELNK